jgi:hypothetical protein
MTRDISRYLFQPRKHYAASRMQQGRTLLDSDYNEGASLEEEEWRRSVLDVVGPHGSPDQGFTVGGLVTNAGDVVPPLPVPSTLLPIQVSFNGNDETFDILPVSVRPGTMYVGGLRVELTEAEMVVFQRDFLQATDDDMVALQLGNRTLLYLDVWEQDVTAVEDDEILEGALGGPDTTVRVRRFRRVLPFLITDSADTCSDAFQEAITALETQNATFDCQTSELQSNGRLKLVFQEGSTGDPCTPDPPAQFLGTENETLRIMLTSPSTYVWAFDNAAPLYRVLAPSLRNISDVAVQNSDQLTLLGIQLLTQPKDAEHQPRPGQVIELLPFGALLDGQDAAPLDPTAPPDPHHRKVAAEVGLFARVHDAPDANGVFTIDVSTRLTEFQDLVTQWDSQHPFASQLNTSDGSSQVAFYMRAWHDAADEDHREIAIGPSPGDALGLTGIIPVLLTPGRRGDFWIAALRPSTPDRVVPFDLLTADAGVPPHGPRHFLAPLAVIDHSDEEVTALHDCRSRMRRLVDAGCVTFTVGDGLHNVGDFAVIQDAVDALPPEGGRVFILPGRYTQNVDISGVHDIVIEGCGEDTIIETPLEDATSGAIFQVSGSPRITIRSLRLEALQQPAISAIDGSDQLTISSLSAIAFTLVSGVRQRGAGDTDERELIGLEVVARTRVSDVHLEPARRPGLDVGGPGSLDVEVIRLSATGANGRSADVVSNAAPTGPMINLRGTQGFTLREATLQTFGQVAVGFESATGNTGTRLSELTITAADHNAGPLRMAVDIDGSDIVLERSEITIAPDASDEAAVVVLGSDITVRDNHIVTLAECLEFDQDIPEICDDLMTPAWGGIHVRGTSSRVTITGNVIDGGLGHGITVGSVLWGDGTNPPTRREGAGKGQVITDATQHRLVTGSLADGISGFTPFDEGVITDLLIVENRIQGMSNNGISTLTVFGLVDEGPADLLEVQGLRIERNTISGNLLHPYDQVAARDDLLPFPAARNENSDPQSLQLSIPVLPFGGIVLATVTEGLTITANSIIGNGQSPVLPTNGIFILNGDGIVIQQNRIAANGVLALDGTDNALQAGVRAGIAVMLAGTDGASSTDDIDKELAVTSDEPHSLDSTGIALRVAGNSVQQPEGRALHVVVAGSAAIDGNFLSSQGFHGAPTPDEGFAIGDVVFVQDLGAPWETTDASAAFNEDTQSFPGFNVPGGTAAYLLNNVARSPRLFMGAGGSLLFNNNQVIYDWDVKRAPDAGGQTVPLSFFAAVLMTLDHVGCVGNHFAFRLGKVPAGLPPPLIMNLPPSDNAALNAPLLSYALVGGGTSQVARNRFAENVQSVILSAITVGQLLNMTVFNTATHPLLAYRPPRLPDPNGGPPTEEPATYQPAPNVELFLLSNFDYEALRRDLLDQVLSFFALLNQP